ncbi:MAG: patatin-like phospholipase family protein, partial [Sporolactobacillus sp.]
MKIQRYGQLRMSQEYSNSNGWHAAVFELGRVICFPVSTIDKEEARIMWIDIVFSGGGVKGFAFVGAIDQLERAGFQFKRAAGTSAGAIVAALLAAGYTSAEMKELMETMDTSQLIDSRSPVSFALFKWLRVYFRMGLYKGDSLEKWLLDVLAGKGVHRFADLPSG